MKFYITLVNSRKMLQEYLFLRCPNLARLWFVIWDMRTARFVLFFAVYFIHLLDNLARGKPRRFVVLQRKRSAAINLWLDVCLQFAI